MALDTAVPQGLEGLIMTPDQQAQMKADLLRRSGYDIERNAKNEAQRVGEDAFGRGMGLSTLNAYYQAQVQRARDEALDKATVGANDAVRQAQGAAVANAAQYVTGQQARAQQEGQFNRAQAQARSMHTQNMVMQGVGGAAHAATSLGGLLYGDKLRKALGGGPGATAEAEKASPYPTNPLTASGYYTGGGPQEGVAPNLNAINPSASPSASPQLSDLSSYSPSSNYGDSSSSYGGNYTNYDPSQFDMSSGWNGLANLVNNNNDWSF